MSSSNADKVTCEHCQRAYAWQEKYAGKKVRCKCGQAIRFPAKRPSEDEISLNLDSGIDLDLGAMPEGAIHPPMSLSASKKPKQSGKPICPSCYEAVRKGAVICVACGFNIKSGSKIKIEVGKESDDQVKKSGGFLNRLKPSNLFSKSSKKSEEK